MDPFGQAYLIEQLSCSLLKVLGGRGNQCRRQCVLEYRALRKKVVILEDETDGFIAERRQLRRIQCKRTSPRYFDGSRSRCF